MKKNDTVVIEGMMSLSEKEYFENKLKQIKIIYIESPKSVRFNRLKKRELRPLNALEAEKRDRYEIDKLGKLKLKKDADVIILNEMSLEEFNKKLESLLE